MLIRQLCSPQAQACAGRPTVAAKRQCRGARGGGGGGAACRRPPWTLATVARAVVALLCKQVPTPNELHGPGPELAHLFRADGMMRSELERYNRRLMNVHARDVIRLSIVQPRQKPSCLPIFPTALCTCQEIAKSDGQRPSQLQVRACCGSGQASVCVAAACSHAGSARRFEVHV
eukprot:2812780-Pleurochrysis_carterae.AAC.1